MDDNDDEFGADADFLEALAAASDPVIHTQTQISESSTLSPDVQPSPQRLDRPSQVSSQTISSAPKVVQPTPQILPSRSSSSSILVSPRQKGNPILINLRSFVWEYSDIPADYVLGMTTCALFLSLKYHRLHPEYIYNRIKGLQGKKKVRRWCSVVDKPFQGRNTQTWSKGNQRNVSGQDFLTSSVSSSQVSGQQTNAKNICSETSLPSAERKVSMQIEETRDPIYLVDEAHATGATDDDLENDKEKLANEKPKTHQRKDDEELSGGIIAALAKLRRENG